MTNADRTLWFNEIVKNIDVAAASFERKLADSREFYFAFGSEHEALRTVLTENPESRAALASAVRNELESFCRSLMVGLDGATGMSDKGLPVLVTDRNGVELSGTLASALFDCLEERG